MHLYMQYNPFETTEEKKNGYNISFDSDDLSGLYFQKRLEIAIKKKTSTHIGIVIWNVFFSQGLFMYNLN